MNNSAGWGVDLAKMIKESASTSYTNLGSNVGTVVSRSPLGVSLLDGKVIIYADVHDIYITRELDRKEIVNGDRLLVVSDNDNQVFFIVDKIRKV